MKSHLVILILLLSISQANTQTFFCGETFTDDRDGQEYATVLIGEQCWMSENLNIGDMVTQNGNNNQLNNSVIEKYCYNNDQNECVEYGGLYQWDEMMVYQTGDSIQGICPDGWHLPSDQEWMQMEMFLGMSEEDANETGFERGTDEGVQLQVGGSTGFDALFGGIWYPDYGFVYNEDYSSPNGYYYTYFWSTTPGTYNNHYMYRNVNTQFETITRWQAEWNFGYSVRCIADEFLTKIAQNKSQTISIYPNPAHDIIYFSKKKNRKITKIELTNISGKRIYLNEKTDITDTDLDISKLPKGIYLIRIYGTNDKLIKFKKIIKQ